MTPLAKERMSGFTFQCYSPNQRPRSAEARDDFIGDQQHVITRADFANQRPVIVGRIDHAAGAVDRLPDEGGNRVRALAEDRFLEFARRRLADCLAGLRPLESVRVARLDVNETGDPRFKHLPVRAHLGGAHRLERDPVVSLLARNDLYLVGLAARLPVKARGLECRFVGFGASRSEKDRLHVVAGNLNQTLRQRDRRNVGRADVARRSRRVPSSAPRRHPPTRRGHDPR